MMIDKTQHSVHVSIHFYSGVSVSVTCWIYVALPACMELFNH